METLISISDRRSRRAAKINGHFPVEPTALRALIRSVSYTGQTFGLAPRRVQANLAILPADSGRRILTLLPNEPQAMPFFQSAFVRPLSRSSFFSVRELMSRSEYRKVVYDNPYPKGHWG
jgi:uncharacterized protein YcsI (UPF0317 family)